MTSTQQQRFYEAAVLEKVRLAAPVARHIVSCSTIDLESGAADENISTRLTQLTGQHGPSVRADQLPQLWASLEACYALGLAVGLLLRPEVFQRIDGPTDEDALSASQTDRADGPVHRT